MVESFSCTGVAARSTKMSFNRRPFQFSPDFGTERCSDVLRDPFEDFEEPIDTMFSEGLPRWDTPPEFQRFHHQAGAGHDFPDGSPFNRPVNSIFSNRFRNSFGEIPVKVSHQRTGSGDASDTESRASGSSDGSTGTGRAPKVHHIPIHVESRPQKKQTSPEKSHGTQEQGPAQHQQSPPKRDSPEQGFYRSSTPQGREGSPLDSSRFSTMPQLRPRTFSDMMQNRARPRVSIPVQVERSDSSPNIGNERHAQRKSPERGPEPGTGTFPRAKNQEAPLKWAQNFFRPKQAQESEQSEPPPQPQPVPPQKTNLTPQEKIDKVLADLRVLINEVQKFEGTDSKSKEYRYLDEMLTRLMLSLDDVITDGNESLRTARKAAVKEVERVIDQLEKKVRANAAEQQQNQPQEKEESSTEPKDQNSAAVTNVAGVTGGAQQDNQQPPLAEASPPPAERPLESKPDAAPESAVQQSRNEETRETSESQTPTPPKRDKSPVKKRQTSPSKDKRSPSPKKESTQRDKSPTKKEASKRDKSPQKKSPETGGVSVTVNGVLLPNTQTPEPTSPEPVTSTASITLGK